MDWDVSGERIEFGNLEGASFLAKKSRVPSRDTGIMIHELRATRTYLNTGERRQDKAETGEKAEFTCE